LWNNTPVRVVFLDNSLDRCLHVCFVAYSIDDGKGGRLHVNVGDLSPLPLANLSAIGLCLGQLVRTKRRDFLKDADIFLENVEPLGRTSETRG